MLHKDDTLTPPGVSYEATEVSLSGTDSCTSSDLDSDPDSDSCGSMDPPNHDYQLRSLAPARAIAASGIACIVWGRDALEFAHRIPATDIDCHLLVDDDRLCEADMLLALKICPPETPYCCQSDVDEVPCWVLLTPMSYYHVQKSWCGDASRTLSRTLSLSLPVENSTLRFPTVFAYLDALIAAYLEPRQGLDWVLEGSLGVYIAQLLECGVAKKDRSGVGRISEADEAVMRGVRENRLFLKRTLVMRREGSWLEWQKERRMMMSGQYEVRGCSCGRCAETETAFDELQRVHGRSCASIPPMTFQES